MPSISSLLSRILPCFKHSPSSARANPSGPSVGGPRTLTDRVAALAEKWEVADRAACARVNALGLRTAIPAGTRQVLHAMCLHLTLRASVRRFGDESGSAPIDLSGDIARAVAALTRNERDALRPHLAQEREWFAWSRSQLLRPNEQVRLERKLGVFVETDAPRLLQSVRKALNAPVAPSPSASAATIDDSGDVNHVLQKAADEIRTSGHWFGLGADLAPHLITSMPGWPKDLSLRIEDKAGKWAPLEFGQLGPDRAPVTVQLDHARQHYSPIVGGRLREVPAKGDCFYESVLRAMRVEDQQALFKGMRFPRGAGMADLIRAMRRQVSEELERQIHLPGGPSDDLRAHVAAAR